MAQIHHGGTFPSVPLFSSIHAIRNADKDADTEEYTHMDGCCHSNPNTDPDASGSISHTHEYERGYHDGYRDGYANASADCLSHSDTGLPSVETRLYVPSSEPELSDNRLEHGIDASINDTWSHRRSG